MSMPRQSLSPDPVILELDPKKHKGNADFHTNISAVAQAGEDLWLGSDELTTLERLSRIGPHRFGEHTVFRLSKYLDLPAGEREEVDVEGIALDGHYLWVTGSHSVKRENVDGSDSSKKAIKRLSRMVRETNRYLLARIPLITDPDSGTTELSKACVDPDDPAGRLTAAQLFGTGRSNMLVDALRDDPHLGIFVTVPGKENGFDIEGLAAAGDRVFLGLRGPVLRGWSVILEIEVVQLSEHLLSLKPIGPHGAPYKKHFVDLDGLGVRELCRDGDDLLILAGPTMDLDGHVLVLRWPKALKAKKQQIVERDDLEEVLEFRFDPNQRKGTNHAEGITLYDGGGNKRSLLVTYDSVGPRKLKGRGAIEADAFQIR
jgi:hypothetical protein